MNFPKKTVSVLVVILLCSILANSQSGGPTKPAKEAKKKDGRSTVANYCRARFQLIRFSEIEFCIPEEFLKSKVRCVDSECARFESERFTLNIDAHIDASFPTTETNLATYTEEFIYMDWGSAWLWSYVSERKTNIAGARYWFSETKNRIISMSMVSETKSVKEVAIEIFKSVRPAD